jgi:hypothetical protein
MKKQLTKLRIRLSMTFAWEICLFELQDDRVTIGRVAKK